MKFFHKLLKSYMLILTVLLYSNLFAGASVSFNDADYLVVAHEELYSSSWTGTLVDLKNDQGLSVGFKLIEDDESINDIKGYISTAYNTGNKPQYLLLVGDACNFDPEDRDLANSNEGNFIPTYFEDYPSTISLTGEFSRDDWYGCLVNDFNEIRGYAVDYFPELYVGRIPAETITEVNTYISKLESYSSIVSGEWRDDILFVSADVDNIGNGCQGSVVEHMTETVADYFIYDAWEKSYLWMSDYEIQAERESAFESGVNSGAMIINAFGTGAHWTNLVEFYFDDSNYSFNNGNELGFLFGASCNIGEFYAYDEQTQEESPVVVEKLLLHSDGIIAAFVPAGGTYQQGNYKLAEHLYKRIYDFTNIRLGPAINGAKRDLSSTATKFIFMGKTFTLLGDPAMDLAWPYSKTNYQSKIACDNKFEFYLNNRLISSGDNWQNAEVSQLDFDHGENVIAVKGIDQGGLAGLLVDIELPINKRLISDETWKCDTEYEQYWPSSTRRFKKESDWVYATEYGQYGVSPWYSNVSGMGSTTAKWIWSDDKYNDNTVYFRKNIFWDDFDDNLRYKSWLSQGGDWNVEDEEFSVEYTSGHNFNFAEYLGLDLDELPSNIEFEVDINKKNSTMCQPGIAFRAEDKNNGYVFMVNGYGSKDWIQIYKVVNGSYYQVGVKSYWDDSDDRLNLNTWYTMKVVVQGDSIKGKVWEKGNPEPSTWHLQVCDNTYDYGKLGLHYCNAHLHFDNVYFTNIADAPVENSKNSKQYTPSYLISMDKDSLEKYVNNQNENMIANSSLLIDNYPDPFNPSTTIRFILPVQNRVKLIVYDIQGKIVSTLVDGYLDAGQHKVEFNASHLSSGAYFYRIEAGGHSLIKKMLLIK